MNHYRTWLAEENARLTRQHTAQVPRKLLLVAGAFLLAVLILVMAKMTHAQPLPPTNQPVPKFKAKTSTHASTAKPATLLTTRPKGTNKPVLFLAIERGPSPYDEYVNVETVLVGKVELNDSVSWQVEQTGRTNVFIATNLGSNHFWNERFKLSTNL